MEHPPKELRPASLCERSLDVHWTYAEIASLPWTSHQVQYKIPQINWQSIYRDYICATNTDSVVSDEKFILGSRSRAFHLVRSIRIPDITACHVFWPITMLNYCLCTCSAVLKDDSHRTGTSTSPICEWFRQGNSRTFPVSLHKISTYQKEHCWSCIGYRLLNCSNNSSLSDNQEFLLLYPAIDSISTSQNGIVKDSLFEFVSGSKNASYNTPPSGTFLPSWCCIPRFLQCILPMCFCILQSCRGNCFHTEDIVLIYGISMEYLTIMCLAVFGVGILVWPLAGAADEASSLALRAHLNIVVLTYLLSGRHLWFSPGRYRARYRPSTQDIQRQQSRHCCFIVLYWFARRSKVIKVNVLHAVR